MKGRLLAETVYLCFGVLWDDVKCIKNYCKQFYVYVQLANRTKNIIHERLVEM